MLPLHVSYFSSLFPRAISLPPLKIVIIQTDSFFFFFFKSAIYQDSINDWIQHRQWATVPVKLISLNWYLFLFKIRFFCCCCWMPFDMPSTAKDTYLEWPPSIKCRQVDYDNLRLVVEKFTYLNVWRSYLIIVDLFVFFVCLFVCLFFFLFCCCCCYCWCCLICIRGRLFSMPTASKPVFGTCLIQ